MSWIHFRIVSTVILMSEMLNSSVVVRVKLNSPFVVHGETFDLQHLVENILYEATLS